MLWRPEGEGRARAGWLRAGLASPRGGKAGGRAPGPLAHSFAPSLRGWVSQSVSLPAAGGPASRRGPEPRTPAPPPAIVRRAAAAVGAGARASEPPVRRGGGGARAGCVCVGARSCPRGDGPGGRSGAAASLSPVPRRPRARGAGSTAFARWRLEGLEPGRRRPQEKGGG